MRTRLLPHPALSLFLLVAWLLLNNSLAPGQIVLGALFGIGIPLMTRRFWPEAPTVGHWGILLRYVAVLLWDILVANMTVARLVFVANSSLRPAFFEMELQLTDDFAITVLTSTISLTPGTISADVSEDRRLLLIHSLDLVDEKELVDSIRRRYEAPLKEIFSC